MAMHSFPVLTAECAGAAARRLPLCIEGAGWVEEPVPVDWVKAREVGTLGGGRRPSPCR